MKKLAAIVILMVALTACNSRYEQENDDNGTITRRTTEKSPFHDVDLEMRGNITFNEDGTAITGIPGGGYVKYSNNEMELEAMPGKNNTFGIVIYDNGEEVPTDSEKGKEFIEEAIKRMQDLQERYK